MNRNSSKTRDATCPSCGEPVELEKDVQVGDMAYCVDCDQELKVLKIEPPKLKAMAAQEMVDGLYPEDEPDEEESLTVKDEVDATDYEDDEKPEREMDEDVEVDDDDSPGRGD